MTRRHRTSEPLASAMQRAAVRWGMKQNGDLQRVLVIDDDDDLAEVVREVLRDSGYAVATVRHGAAALELVRHISPNLILLDLTMPIMDGWSFLGQYRRNGKTSARIVLLTGNPHAPEIARSLGADGYLSKPFEIDDLIGVVTRELPLN